MRSARSAAFALLALSCAGGPPALDHCRIEVTGIEDAETVGGGIDLAYRVRGAAGSRGTVWLAARNPSGTYVPGYGVEVGPGAFEAIVELELTGMPEKLVTVLEVSGRRCKADAPLPGS